MNILLYFGEKYITNENDVKQNSLLKYITNIFFPWLCLTLVFNDKTNKKTSLTTILILHWFLKASGDVLSNIADFFPVSNNDRINNYWPYTSDRWFIGNAVSSLFWICGEIIGDCKKATLVLIICILYNISKIVGIISYFIVLPADCRRINENGKLINNLLPHTKLWWSSVTVSIILNFLYNLSVIYAIKSEYYNKKNNFKKYSLNTFSDKFKTTSELRIIISSIANLIFLPFIGIIVYNMAYYAITDFQKIMLINPESIRQAVININYHLLYIDQILLKQYVYKNNNNLERLSATKKNSKILNINDINIGNIEKIDSPTTPNSVSTYIFNEKESIYKRNTLYNNNSCESINSIENSLVTLKITNDNSSIKSSDTITNNRNKTNNIYLNDDNKYINNEYRNRLNSIYTNDESEYINNNEISRLNSIYTNDENEYTNNNERNRLNSIYTVDENVSADNVDRNKMNSIYTIDENVYADNGGRNRFNSIYTIDESVYADNGGRNRINSIYTIDDSVYADNGGRNRFNSIYTNDSNENRNDNQSFSKSKSNSVFTNNSMYSNNDNSTIYSNSIYSYYGNDNKNKQQNTNNILSPIADISYEEDSLMLTKL
ncbi:hypothetical protein PIROE2DRAFT_8674 [Piromyces sp. E2]|nr:hypothetical protein PIROE2DRAFT_8674 [Piromyces sp. E2]|eukprot:OUM64515.1 hypothetical protein PIROE2DRAFT_8674 [Piromyces sp. E2]